MFKFLIRGVCAVMASTAFMPCTSSACCFSHCFDCFKRATPAPTYATTYAAPVCPAPACNVCPQQVSYVPQTSFRTEYTCVPVTTCRPITTCDPCGGAQTVMQPVTTFVRRPVTVPVTTMRPVVTQAGFATPSCPTCGAGAAAPYYSGATSANFAAPVAAPTPGCATCGGGASVNYGSAQAMYSYPASAATPGYVGQPAMAAPMGVPAMSAPSMSAPTMGSPTPAMANPSFTPAPTYQAPPAQSSSLSYPATPIPDNDPKTNSNTAPSLNPQTRTTSNKPLLGPAWVTTAIFRTADRAKVFQPASQSTPAPQNNDGWSGVAPNADGWQATGR